MENAIKHLRIQNFKSIKDVTLKPRRVNIIIGEPNVGKSNILEAMSLLGEIVYEQTEKFMGSFIRYEEPRQLFYDNLVANTIKVETDNNVAVLWYDNTTRRIEFLSCENQFYASIIEFSNKYLYAHTLLIEQYLALLNLPAFLKSISRAKPSEALSIQYLEIDTNSTYRSNSKAAYKWKLSARDEAVPRSYLFQKKSAVNQDSADRHLLPPDGDNLINIIQLFPKLRHELAQIFKQYNQKLQLRIDERRLEIIKDQDGVVYSFPYSSIADTLQRFIFYLAAIASNDDAIILLEEPEAHSFPVYISKLGRHIVESRNNQFFIVTHSDYLVTEILEQMLTDDELTGELAFFAAYYEDHQTKVHQLSDQEIFDIRADGLDVFYNMKRFTTNRADA